MVRKAAAIKAFVTFLDREHGSSDSPARGPTDHRGPPPTAGLPGVGEGNSADAILLYALLHPVAVVDEYLRRITDRHGLAGRRQIWRGATTGGYAFANDPPEFRLRSSTNSTPWWSPWANIIAAHSLVVRAVPWPCFH